MTIPTSPTKPKNYLNNKDILAEIHLSKNSYCSYSKIEYNKYDLIVDLPHEDLVKSFEYILKPTSLQQAKEAKAIRLSQETGETISPSDVKTTDLVFRVMTWAHIPVAQKQPKKSAPKKFAKDIILVDNDDTDEFFADLEDPVTKDEIDDKVHVKVNFPPFQHYKIDEFNNFQCVGKSHWKGDIDNGEFCKDHGNITNKLAKIYIMMCEKYAMKYNWRGYCVDVDTKALTKRGWLTIDQINENDTIMSYNNGKMAWSAIKSIYRGEFDGNMFQITSRTVDMLITPNHKLLTRRGLKPVELLTQADNLILMGTAEDSNHKKIFSDEFVELAGWIFSCGDYDIIGSPARLKEITIFQSEVKNTERIRSCIKSLNFDLHEKSKASGNIFTISTKDATIFYQTFPKKNPTMEFICALTAEQRDLLIDIMLAGDSSGKGETKKYIHSNRDHLEVFEALCSMSGIRTITKKIISDGKLSNYQEICLYPKRNNVTTAKNLNMHGAVKTGKDTGAVGKGKQYHPNEPTVLYKGRVWCPQTQFGTFLAKRNNHIYLTGNTYRDEMQNSAILQLTYVGLRFNEAKSANPFAYYTQTITNSFCRILNSEKRNQNIRDDILELNGLQPSWTRQGMGGTSSSYYDE